jgi:hypothetical protein
MLSNKLSGSVIPCMKSVSASCPYTGVAVPLFTGDNLLLADNPVKYDALGDIHIEMTDEVGTKVLLPIRDWLTSFTLTELDAL